MWQEVTVSGTLTGLGDQVGHIVEVEYCKMSDQYFYVVRTKEGQRFRAQEKFVSKN